MKHAALIVMVLIGTSAVSFAQDGKKQTEPTKTTETKKISKRTPVKETKKQEGPAKKIN